MLSEKHLTTHLANWSTKTLIFQIVCKYNNLKCSRDCYGPSNLSPVIIGRLSRKILITAAEIITFEKAIEEKKFPFFVIYSDYAV